MIDLAWFLWRAQWRNRLRKLVVRAQRPRDLAGLLLGLLLTGGLLNAWVLFALLGPIQRQTGPPERELIASLTAGLQALLVTIMLFGARRDDGPGLAGPELPLLLGAPVTRRQLLGFWLVGLQPAHLVVAGLLVLLALPVLPLGPAIGWAWLLAYLWAVAMSLGGVAVAHLTSAWVARGGQESDAALRLPFWLWVAFALGCAASSAEALAFGSREEVLATPLGALFRLLRAPAAAVLTGTDSDCLAMAARLATLDLLLLAVVLWRPPPFEEAALRQARRLEVLRSEGAAAFVRQQQRERARQARRAPGRPAPPWALAPTGRPATALLWKGLITSDRQRLGRLLAVQPLAGLAAGLLLGWALAGMPAPGLLGGAALAVGCLVSVSYAFSKPLDLEAELPHLDILRVLPLAGRDVLVGCSLRATTLVLGHGAMCLLFAAGVASGWTDSGPPPWTWTPIGWGSRLTVAAALLVLLSSSTFALASLASVTVLVWPGWSDATGGGLRGLGSMLVRVTGTVATLLPPGLALAGYVALASRTGAWLPLALPAAALSALLSVGVALIAIQWAAPRWDRFDPAELRS